MDTSNNGKELSKSLPPYIPSSEASENFKLLDVIGHQFDDIDEEIEAAFDNSHVQTARGIEELTELAKLVNLAPISGEPLERFRLRVISRYLRITGEGTISEIINAAAMLLDIDTENIRYSQSQESWVIVLEFDEGPIQNQSISTERFRETLTQNLTAGARVELILTGGFEHISITEYNSVTPETGVGYDGLDENGEPIEDGETYAGTF